jgi:excisionase family DNA binding protein
VTPADYMTTAEFAALVRVPPATVRYWRHIGKGPASIKVGRHVLYATTDVRAWLKQLAAQQSVA